MLKVSELLLIGEVEMRDYLTRVMSNSLPQVLMSVLSYNLPCDNKQAEFISVISEYISTLYPENYNFDPFFKLATNETETLIKKYLKVIKSTGEDISEFRVYTDFHTLMSGVIHLKPIEQVFVFWNLYHYAETISKFNSGHYSCLIRGMLCMHLSRFFFQHENLHDLSY